MPADRTGPLDLAPIKERLRKASDGPWHASRPTSVFHGSQVIAGAMPSYGEESGLGPSQADRNAEFIAHARADVPALVEEVERLRAALDEAQLRSIEARNPGIDMDEVRRIGG